MWLGPEGCRDLNHSNARQGKLSTAVACGGKAGWKAQGRGLAEKGKEERPQEEGLTQGVTGMPVESVWCKGSEGGRSRPQGP